MSNHQVTVSYVCYNTFFLGYSVYKSLGNAIHKEGQQCILLLEKNI